MDILQIVLVIALLAVLLVLVWVLLRRRDSAGPDEASLRRLLGEALQSASTLTGAVRSGDDSGHPAVQVDPAATAAILEAANRDANAARKRARDEADRMHAEALADADRIARAARTEVASLREGIGAERARLAEDATRALAADRTELTGAQEQLRVRAEALADDRKALAADRDRLRVDQSDLGQTRSELTAQNAALRSGVADLNAKDAQLVQRQAELAEREASVQSELERVSGLSAEKARAELLARQEEVVHRDVAFMIRRVEAEAEATAKQRARAIVADAIQRVASDQTSQSVVSVMQLPTDDIKGRIIGREGRNIRAFETVTGVNVIIDDTPEAVLLSCFDPVRREVGRLTLQALIDDGRIHPHRIEEAYERAKDEVAALCRRAAEDAMLEVGISDLHPELVLLLGRLKYRTSYGQNVLGHLVETSHIARAMAAELGVDPVPVARGAFLHDIGKALTHEVQGSHAIIGADLARRYGESEDVAHSIEAHHDEVPPGTVEAVLTQAADACSGGRPGARRESLESYVQRLERIEAIAASKKGVEKVFAMQAGRELRVMVKPELVDDLEAHMLAREVAKQIEEELTYPGQVRVTVIRESRATEVAR